MKNFIRGFLLAFLVAQSAIAAGEPVYLSAQLSKAPALFLIAGILRTADGGLIKLVQSVHQAGSRDEAIGAFTREVLARYPGFAPVDMIVTALPSQKTACGISI